jgi:hypothetical protein
LFALIITSFEQSLQLLLVLNLLGNFTFVTALTFWGYLYRAFNSASCASYKYFFLNLMVTYSCRNASQVENVSVDDSIWLKEKWNPGEVIVFYCPC